VNGVGVDTGFSPSLGWPPTKSLERIGLFPPSQPGRLVSSFSRKGCGFKAPFFHAPWSFQNTGSLSVQGRVLSDEIRGALVYPMIYVSSAVPFAFHVVGARA